MPETTDGRAVWFPFSTMDFSCPRCRCLIRRGEQVVSVEGNAYCDLVCARVEIASEDE